MTEKGTPNAQLIDPKTGGRSWIVKKNPEEPPPAPFEEAHLKDLKQLERVCDYISGHFPERKGQPIDEAFMEILSQQEAKIVNLSEPIGLDASAWRHRAQQLETQARAHPKELEDLQFLYETGVRDSPRKLGMKQLEAFILEHYPSDKAKIENGELIWTTIERMENLSRGVRHFRGEHERIEEKLHPYGAQGEPVMGRINRLIEARNELKEDKERLWAFFKERPPHTTPSDPVGSAILVMGSAGDELNRLRGQLTAAQSRTIPTSAHDVMHMDLNREVEKGAAVTFLEKKHDLLDARVAVVEHQLSELPGVPFQSKSQIGKKDVEAHRRGMDAHIQSRVETALDSEPPEGVIRESEIAHEVVQSLNRTVRAKLDQVPMRPYRPEDTFSLSSESRRKARPLEHAGDLDPLGIAEELLESNRLTGVETKAVGAVKGFLENLRRGEPAFGGGIDALREELESFQGIPVPKPCACGHALAGHVVGDLKNPIPGRCLQGACECSKYTPLEEVK